MHTPEMRTSARKRGEGGLYVTGVFPSAVFSSFFGEGGGGGEVGGRSFKWIVAVSSAQESFISRQKGRQGCDSCLREETNGQPQPDV